MALLLNISKSDPRPLYRQIMDEIRRAAFVGSLETGERLPSIRHLAVELRVNPNTVKQAYNELEREGLVEVRRGQGTFLRGERAGAGTRRRLAREVARRALRDAWRHGLGAGDLVKAIREQERRGAGGPGGKGGTR